MQGTEAVERSARTRALPAWVGLWGVVGIGVLLFVLRITGPSDFADGYHQERAGAYVMDALRNGNWICQYGMYGEVSSKPPMFTWLAALASLPFGHATWFTMVLPGGLATLAIAAMTFFAGERFFGRAAGFLGAVAYLLSPTGVKQIVLARIDGVFALSVSATALLGFRAWQIGRGWKWFWVAAAMATLTKGPLGVLLGGFGLAAVIWERRTGFPTRLAGSQWFGIVLFCAITLGWFGLAYWKMGQPLIDVMVGDELVGHAVQSQGKRPGELAYLPTLYFLGRFAPWSALAFWGFWRIWKRPAGNEGERRFERFLFCWFFGGLLVFSLAPHQRPDLIFPLLPAAALVAGRELARLLDGRGIRLGLATGVIVVIALGGAVAKYHGTERNDSKVLETLALKEIAGKVAAAGGGEFPLIHVDSSYALQFYLRTKRPLVPVEFAAKLLRGAPAAFVAVNDLKKLESALGDDFAKMHRVAEWRGRREACYLISNHPRLEWRQEMVMMVGPALLTLRNVEAVQSKSSEFRFKAKQSRASVMLQQAYNRRVRVEVVSTGESKVLTGTEPWEVEFQNELVVRILPEGEAARRVSL